MPKNHCGFGLRFCATCIYCTRSMKVCFPDIFNSPQAGGWSIAISISVCMYVWLSVCFLSVWLSARIFQKPHVRKSPNFLDTLVVAVARSSSVDNAICYVLPVLWIASCMHIMEQIGQTYACWLTSDVFGQYLFNYSLITLVQHIDSKLLAWQNMAVDWNLYLWEISKNETMARTAVVCKQQTLAANRLADRVYWLHIPAVCPRRTSSFADVSEGW